MNVFNKLARQTREALIILFFVLLFIAALLWAKQYYPGSDYFIGGKEHDQGDVLAPKSEAQVPASKGIDSVKKPVVDMSLVPKLFDPMLDPVERNGKR